MRFLGSSAMGSVVTLACLVAGDVGATTYSFTRIADSTTISPAGTLDVNGLGNASISGGTVAFRACYDGGTGCGIFSGSGGTLTTIVKDGTAAPMGTFISDFTLPVPFGPESFAQPPAISGTTAVFQAGYQFNELSGTFDKFGIFNGSGGVVTTVAKTGDTAPSVPPTTFSTFLNPAISGATVAFQGSYGASKKGIFSSSGGPLVTIATSEQVDPIGGIGMFTGFKAPALSGSTVAFEADYSGGQGIFTGSGGALTKIAKTGDAAPIGSFDPVGFFEPTISGSTAAFRGRYGGSSGTGIFRGDGGPLTTIAKTGDPAPTSTISGFPYDPSISGNTVAFVANYAATHALFTGSGGALAPVLKKGDLLFGSTVASITFDKFGLDPAGSGKLAFTYTLVDGRTGVAMAVPGELPIGDYNRNGSIDAADYVIWRDTLGQFVAQGEGADGNFNGVIDTNDYFLWRSRFGQQAELGTGSAEVENANASSVPEPSACALLGYGVAWILSLRRRRR